MPDASPGPRLGGFILGKVQKQQPKIRVACFIDGFNLYHAITNLRRPHLKWVDLRSLMSTFTDPKIHDLVKVYYFSAYATWLPTPYRRHREYVAALKSVGVSVVMGGFKEKERNCKACGAKWTAHEEKETDVNMAIWLLNEAYKDTYDEAYFVSRDSDFAPAIRMVKQMFPEKKIRIIGPPKLGMSRELVKASRSKKCKTIKPIHLERSLLPAKVKNSKTGKVMAVRPNRYTPPSKSK